MQSKINKLMQKFDFKGQSGSLQYWEYKQAGHRWGLTVVGQPFRSTKDHIGLEGHRNWCLGYSNVLVGPDTEVDQEWLAGLAALNRVEYQRTSRDPDQFLGQLVVPVFFNQGAHEKFAGVIEFATVYPKEDYAADFSQIQFLLKNEKLTTRPMEKMIKVTYGKKTMIKFPLSLSSGIAHLWENMTERINEVNQKAFQVEYKDRSGNRILISSDNDLQACITNSSSNPVYMFIEPVA